MAVAHALFVLIVEEREGLCGLEILYNNQKNYQTLVRWSKGVDIDAACGQLSTQN